MYDGEADTAAHAGRDDIVGASAGSALHELVCETAGNIVVVLRVEKRLVVLSTRSKELQSP